MIWCVRNIRVIPSAGSSYLRSLLLFPSQRCTRSSSLITFSRSPSLLKLKVDLIIILLLLWNSLSHLIYVTLLIT